MNISLVNLPLPLHKYHHLFGKYQLYTSIIGTIPVLPVLYRFYTSITGSLPVIITTRI